MLYFWSTGQHKEGMGIPQLNIEKEDLIYTCIYMFHDFFWDFTE